MKATEFKDKLDKIPPQTNREHNNFPYFYAIIDDCTLTFAGNININIPLRVNKEQTIFHIFYAIDAHLLAH